MTDFDPSDYGPETLALHAGHTPDQDTMSRAVPIYQTTSYVFRDTEHAAGLFDLTESGHIYSRLSNPTTDVLERRLAALHDAVGAVATASGMAAIFYAVATLTSAGQNIVTGDKLYGGTYTQFCYPLKRFGIEARFADHRDPRSFEKLIDASTRAIYCESLGNPAGNVTDFEALAAIAHRHGIPLIVDNTVPTPYLIRPIEWGADIVVHSLTKFAGGHGTSIGGAIVDGGTFDFGASGRFKNFVEPDPSYHGLAYWPALGHGSFILKARVQLLRDLGMAISPFNAFLIIQGLETLSLRMERHFANADKVAKYLVGHPQVESVNYAGLATSPWHERAKKYGAGKGYGSIIAFDIRGGREAGQKFVEALQLHSHVANIGDVRSLVIHPASTTHSQLTEEEQASTGVRPGQVRLSVGLETIDDILADLETGLGAAKGA